MSMFSWHKVWGKEELKRRTVSSIAQSLVAGCALLSVLSWDSGEGVWGNGRGGVVHAIKLVLLCPAQYVDTYGYTPFNAD